MALALECETRSDVGHRSTNEDAAYASPRMAAIADGLGGAAAGEVASRAVVDALARLDERRADGALETALQDAVSQSNGAISSMAASDPDKTGMSTTLTAVALANDERLVVTNIGDSRTYLLRDGELTQLTRDDSLVQMLVDAGEITAEQARRHPRRSVLLDALDGRERPDAPLTSIEARPGDRILLCSDGLSDAVEDAAIATALAIPSRAECTDRLIELALAAGGQDNISVVVADVAWRREGAGRWARTPAGAAARY
jgi:serine/threonine protein phosphatase PrpC